MTPYLVAVGMTAAMFGVRIGFASAFGDARPLLPFIIAVMVSGYVGGLGPGLLATMLGAVAGNLVAVQPHFALSISPLLILFSGAYVIVGAIMSLLCERMHEARRKLELAVQERQQAEEALRATETRFKSTLKHSPVILATQDADLRFTWIFNLPEVPPALRRPDRPQQLAEADLLGKTDEAMLPPDEAAGMIHLKRQALAEGVRKSAEFTFGTGDYFRAYDVVVEPVQDEAGTIVGLNEVAIEVTERHKTQEALRQSEARLGRIFEANLIGFVYGNRDGMFLGANDKFLEIIGYTREELETGVFNAFSITAPEHLEVSRSTQRDVEAAGGASYYEKVYLRKDGTRVPVLIGKTMLEPGSDVVVAFVMDLTQLKRTELELSSANTRLTLALARERNIAVALQRSLTQMPEGDLLPGFQVHADYEPAWEEADVGGDFVDAFLLDERHMAVVVGDVSGKGLSAAARTAEIKYTLRRMLYERRSPAAALAGLNEYLCDPQRRSAQPGEEFVCAIVGVVERETGKISISVGGSEPPLFVRVDGAAEEASVRGTPLGVFPEMVYQEEEALLGHGDLLVLTTDGITEARRGTEFFGYDGLSAAAAQYRHTPDLAELTAKLVGEARAFAGDALHDDACLLLVRRV